MPAAGLHKHLMSSGLPFIQPVHSAVYLTFVAGFIENCGVPYVRGSFIEISDCVAIQFGVHLQVRTVYHRS